MYNLRQSLESLIPDLSVFIADYGSNKDNNNNNVGTGGEDLISLV